MNPNEPIPQPEETVEELDMAVSSVDDFIRELEAKEKDLHITADMRIEIEDSDFDGDVPLPDFVREELDAPSVPAAEPSLAAVPTPLKANAVDLENELKTLRMRVFELRTERNEVQEKSDRRVKDFENYKYRMDRERRGSFIDQIANLATQMLPVLDNLHRAIDSVPSHAEAKDPAFKQFFDGIVLVNQQVNEVFSDMGVEPIAADGRPFDPNFHEAVATEDREDMPANTISEELLRGYRIGNRVIRHSMVKVSKGSSMPVENEVVAASDEDRAVLASSETEPVAAPDGN